MKRIGIALAATSLLIAAAPADAHQRADRYYDGHRHVHYGYRHHMPRWLRRHGRFVVWYRHTPLKYNRRLDWGELYSIFLWERRFSNHRRFHHYGHRGHRDFKYYRKYWKHGHRYDRRRYHDRYDDRRKRRRHRDDDDRYDDWDDDDRRGRRRRD